MSSLSIFIKNITALTVFENRYGGGFCALLEARDEQHLADWATGGDENWARSQLALDEVSWFPMAYGNIPEEAIEELIKKLDSYSNDDTQAILYGIAKVSSILAGEFENLIKLKELPQNLEALRKEYFGEDNGEG